MKVVAFNGSPRTNGNTAAILNVVLGELEKHGIETEFVQVGGTSVIGCTSCYTCVQSRAKHCVVETDPLNEWIDKIMEADGIILGSPVYFHGVTAEMTAFMHRTGFVARANERMFKRKVGAAVVALRRNGAISALDTMTHYLNAMQFYIVGGSNNVIANKLGEYANDEEGMQNMRILGENMASLIKTRNTITD